MDPTPDAKELLEWAVAVTAELEAMLPSAVRAETVSTTATTPFKAHILRGTMLLRLHDLADAACSLFQAERVIPGLILARAAIETAAILYVLRKKMREAVDRSDIKDTDDFLVRTLGGSHYFEGADKPYRAGTAIEHVAKEHEYINDVYSWLSEHTHPNRLGGGDAYSRYDEQRRAIMFEFNRDEVRPEEGYVGVVASIGLAFDSVAQIDSMMAEFVALCERTLRHL